MAQPLTLSNLYCIAACVSCIWYLAAFFGPKLAHAGLMDPMSVQQTLSFVSSLSIALSNPVGLFDAGAAARGASRTR